MRFRARTVGLSAAAVIAMGVVLPGGTTAATAAASCAGTGGFDFNGDGVRDTAVADPEATVGGVVGAGLVRVVLGGGKGVLEISQATAGMPATPEAHDQFGQSLTTLDYDQDGCTDLAIGTPLEDVTSADGVPHVDAGAVYVVRGAPTGLGAVSGWSQSSFDPAATAESYDWFGWSLQGGNTAAGEPYLAVGAPGEGVITDGVNHPAAGCIQYRVGTTTVNIDQDDPNVPGIAEENDRFGYSLGGTNRYLAVGAPGEAIGDLEFAGGVTVFSQTPTDGRPTPLAGIDQDTAGVTGVPEAGDGFGSSISMTYLRPSDETYNSDAALVVGIPGEDIGTTTDAGSIAVLQVDPQGALHEINSIDRDTADVEGDPTQGDHFGFNVTVQNQDTSVVTTADTARIAVGVPGDDSAAADGGAVQVFSMLGTPGTGDRILTRGGLLPGTAHARDYVGMSVGSSASTLFVGIPYSKAGGEEAGTAAYLNWATAWSGSGTTYPIQPGSGGVPAAGTAFGRVMR
ncbi:FG-GAP repeat protein [Streptomyces sp. NPDC008150]|uniref:FG-GAP repeat protein n=1 Tax=Streptomyces sp. NPDC008150 TaxID=3364816 RepID=UPI0036EFCA7C